jgi:hypothetical protein
MNDKHCVFCGSPNVNLWKSWNVVGEWTCDDCAPIESDCDPGDDL